MSALFTLLFSLEGPSGIERPPEGKAWFKERITDRGFEIDEKLAAEHIDND